MTTWRRDPTWLESIGALTVMLIVLGAIGWFISHLRWVW